MDGDVINVVVALVVIYGVYRWWSSSDNAERPAQSNQPSLGFRPKRATPEMVASVHSAFPQEPLENIHYDLLKTGDVQITSNKLLERGYLERPPPAYFAIYPTSDTDTNTNRPTSQQASRSGSSTPAPNLISRFHLEDRVKSPSGSSETISDDGRAAWEATPAQREASLKERKAQMIIAARQRLLAQKQAQSTSSAP